LRAAVAWRGVRAEALARRGEHAAAVEFARAAVAIASATDALLDHAAARRALGAALRAAGRGAEADAEEARTIELWEAKGATLLVERARKQAPRVVERATEQRAAPVPGTRRRVRANAATASAARFDAAIGARDHKALANFFPEDHQAIDHTTACEEGRQEAIAGYRAFLEAEDPSVEHVPLA